MKHRYVMTVTCALGAALLPALASAQDPTTAPTLEAPALEAQATAPGAPNEAAGGATQLPPIAATSEPAAVAVAAPVAYLPPGAIGVDPYGNPVFAPTPQPAARAPRTITPMRGTLGLGIGYLGLMGNQSYANTARLWGFGEFRDAMVVGLDGGVHVSPNILIGARVGYLLASAGRGGADRAELSLDSVDVGAIVRAGAPVALGRDWVFFPGVQVAAGAAMPRIRLRNETQGTVLPRVAGELIALFASRYVGLSMRIGYQYLNWSNAAAQGVDLSMSGFSLALGLEVRL